MTQLPHGGRAVMSGRKEPLDSLDFFPTPPWATRGLCVHALHGFDLRNATVLEPAAGEGHMAEVLREYFGMVLAADVHDYGRDYEVGSYIGEGPDVLPRRKVDWIITNPPFNAAAEFAERALSEANEGVALLVRTQWLEGAERYRLFVRYVPTIVAIFSERVPMVKGRWDPQASSMTSYAWVVWHLSGMFALPRIPVSRLMWIPPGSAAALTKPDDVRRFARPA